MRQSDKTAIRAVVAIWLIITAGIYAWARAAGQGDMAAIAYALLWPVIVAVVVFLLFGGG
jgi:hypothetical protein